jgi:hypothetical protein
LPDKELRGLSPNGHIHVSMSDIFLRSAQLFSCSRIDGPMEYKIAHRDMNVGIGTVWLRSSFPGNT